MNVPSDQEAIRAKCFHPSGKFVELSEQDVETTIPERFEKVVQLYPDKLAVKVGDRALSYDELNRAANRVAHAILEKGSHRLNPILVLADHSITAIVACLGVLKAGKIMVAVDPLFPVDRLKSIADDSNAEAILTNGLYSELATNLASRDRSVVNVDALGNAISTENINSRRSPLDSAINRYTSGSTGKPKGVLRNHQESLATYRARINASHLCPQDRKIILRRLSFSVTDAFSGLMVGASVFPYDIKEHGLKALGGFLNKELITYFVATPSIFRYFVKELNDSEEFPHLRIIQLGGEPLFRSDVGYYKKHFPLNCFLLNQYSSGEMGPVCQFWITKEAEMETSIVPAGYPVSGKKVSLLNDEQKEVGINEIGEIAVASRYLSAGYWNNSALTNEKFLPSNESAEERLYLSGDLGRKLPDGCLLYVGRKDEQVKIRGAKVEIREIEALLSEHPQIKQSAVLAIDRESGDKELIAYLVPLQKTVLTVTDIKAYLRIKLPDYMVPSAIIFLESLPLVNGKLDHKSLPPPSHARPELNSSYAEAKNDTELSLVQIWEEVLGVHPIGIHDNFFDLGGHSLAATRVVSRVFEHYQLEIPLQSLFNSPTVAEMAVVITEHQGKMLDDSQLATILDELVSLSDVEAQMLGSVATSTITKK